MQAREDYAQVFYKLKPDETPGANFEGGGTRDAPPSGGVLATAGGLVVTSSREGYFIVLDAATGRLLWRFNTGGQIHANPIAFEAEGKQCLAMAAGQGLFTFALAEIRTRQAGPPVRKAR
jgi:outer membrane protein assembly factor BamB